METCDSPSLSRQENGQQVSKLRETTHLDNEVPEKILGMETDKENSPADDNLRTEESRREIALGFGLENSVGATTKEIPCNECATSFSSLQEYMEHHCPNARLPLLKDENESEVSDLDDSDVENMTGEIVYQPDGSAFILEDSKEGGLDAQSGVKSLFSPALFSNSQTAAGDKTEQSATAPMSFYPQMINTFHIASSLGKPFTADQAFPNTSALAGDGPVLHSFRVYDLRHKSDKDYLTFDGAAKNSCVSKDVPNNVDLSKFDGYISDGKRKPILMCFLCKLSFGYSRSFVTHAVHDHRMTLNEQEQKLLSNKYVSAIIQGIGKDKEPLISFLEPKNNNSVLPHFSTANFMGPDPGMRSLWNTFHMENGDSLQAGFAFLKGSASLASSADQSPRSAQMPKAELNLGGAATSVRKSPVSSVTLQHLSPGAGCRDQESNCERQKDVSTLHANGELPIKTEPRDVTDAEEDDDTYSNDLDDDGNGELGDSTSSKDFPLLNQSICPLSSSVLKFTERGTTSSVTDANDLEKTKQVAACLDYSNDSNSGGSKDGCDSNGGRDGTPPSHDLMRRDDESPGPLHQHAATPSTPGTPGPGEGSPGSGVECPKCDTVLGSSRSLGGHMTMMHSRNSCKTLKCPKCNWHYKYQQTLDAHMKEKHPESGGSCVYCSTGQPHPRLARGESYTCGYKPFRCEVCNYSTTTKGNLSIHMQSDKHLNNVQTLQNGGTEAIYNHTAPVSNTSLSGCGTPSPSKPKQKPTWRCEVCDYETNVARNLRIHMTSEKHMHNMMLLQQNMKQIQHNLHLGLAPAEAELYQYYLAQNIGLTGMKLENPSDPQMMINPFQLDPSTAAALTPGHVNNELPAELRLASGQLMGDDLSVLSAGELSPCINDPLLKLYQCAVCNKFSSDSLEALSGHVAAERSLPEEEWRAMMGDVYQCKLCNYNTQLKANFQLHCKTDKHMQKYQLVAHIKEGGKSNQWRLKCIAIGNPVHLKCNACDYYSNSVEKLRLHATNQRHEAVLKVYKHLQKQESACNSESCYYYCALCDYSTRAKLNLLQHLRSVQHQQSEGLRKLQLHQQGFPADDDNLADIFFVKDCPPNESEEPSEDSEESPRASSLAVAEDKDSSGRDAIEGKTTEKDSRINTLAKETLGTATAGKRSLQQEKENDTPPKRPKSADDQTLSNEQVQQCPYCNYSNNDANRLQLHIMSQHSMQPIISCPLCQDVLSNKIHLQLHLTHLHSVAPDCVEKLLMTVAGPDVSVPNNSLLSVSSQDKVPSLMDCSTVIPEGAGKPMGIGSKDTKTSTGQDKNEAERNNEELKPPKEAIDGPDWKKASSQDRKSPDSLQEHLSDQQKRQQLSVSDRHVYKYRCNHCSLAFKTMQKLEIHSQYHAIRAATMCSLCQRSFRTFLALRKHLETGHPELSEAEVQQLCGSLPLNGDIVESEMRALEEAHAFENELDKEDELDQEGKASPTGSDSSSLLDDMGSEPKRTLPFRKGPNFTMEKFLDPSRPYKCTVCKESFTQKNILLVHYNSVSHLHKLKKVIQEASSPVPQETSNNVDNKPYKCNTCNVAYSQSSTLEIHMRSVLHQTKARTAKMESSSSTGGGSSGSTSARSPVPLNQGNTDSAGAQGSSNKENTVDAKEVTMKQTTDHISVQPAHPSAQSQAQLQMQLQHELQQQAAFFQPQFLNPAFFPHFPMTPDALMQFQQPQFLFPFYIPGAEFNISPELALHSAAFGMPGMTGSFLEDLKQQMQQQHQLGQQQQLQLSQQQAQHQASQSQMQQKAQQLSHRPKTESNHMALSEIQMSKDAEEHLEKHESKAKQDLATDGDSTKENKDSKKPTFSEPLIPPPRIISGARGNVAKALLENFGFELVIQYNENRQKSQKKNREEGLTEKLECGVCGKLFSNILILKSHQEHVHGQFFPYVELEKFAQQYRDAYDKLYPINPASPETPPPPPPPAPVTTLPASTSVGRSQTPSPAPLQILQQPPPPPPPPPPPQHTAPPQVQLPVSLDMPMFPPLMMQSVQHPGLPPQLALQLPTMDSLSSDLTQLCQQQLGLDPNFLRQSQFKRPRTRITDDQLKVLRAHFDINNSPNEEQIQEMADKSGLPQKVIKHWFRNTLFKERQRSKDSPYNFSIPPMTTLEDIRLESQVNMLEYYRTDATANKRSSRTRFTDYQLRVLQDFFDTNAYPKDDEIEQLSTVLNLPTRVIVVWFQNARQKARKSYENQADAKDTEKKELTNERYIRTNNMQYQCKKCNVIFPRIFDLITHQKKLCYKDEDDEAGDENHSEESAENNEQIMTKHTEPSRQPFITASSSGSSSPLMPSPRPDVGKTSPKPELLHEKSKVGENALLQNPKSSTDLKSPKASTPQPPQQKVPQISRPHSQPQSAAVPSSPLSIALSSLNNSLPPQMLQYHCDQCKIAFPTVELWQEHQHMHFLAAQNQFLHSQFLERPMDMPYMIFDPNNPLMTSQLLSGALSQMPTPSNSGLASTVSSNAMKRKLEEKDDGSHEKDSINSGEDQHRDKRLRTTITPEQLEILYEKYLLDSNPTRKMLDHIAHEVGLKKRVVQVWFQNTRARERKGQFRALGPSQSHKKCPFCRALFKAKSALDSHIRSRHWHEAKQAGFSLPPSPMMAQEDEGQSPQKHNFSDYLQMATKTEVNDSELPTASSTPVKTSELALRNLLNLSCLKTENSDELDGLNMSSTEASFDASKIDFDETSSINTAVSDATTGDETNNEVENLTINGSEKMSENKTNQAQLMELNEDRFLFSMVSPSQSFSGKDSDYFYCREEDFEDNADKSETSSLADPSSPSPFGAANPFKSAHAGGERPGHKRFRTQMSNLQLKVLKACFSDYRTPTMQECEMLGSEIGLPKRVVQVWFQNARAKEKKFKINIGKPFMISQGSPDGPRPECILCRVKYTARLSIRDHIFSKQHIAKVQETLGNQVDREKDYLAPTTVRQLMAQQELDRLKKATDILNLPAQQQPSVDNNALHGLSLPTAYPGISGLPPVLLPGVNGPSSLPGFPPNTPALASPGAGMLGFPTPATPSPAMSLSSTPTKSLLQTPPPPPPPPALPLAPSPLAANQTEQHIKESEKDKKFEKPKVKEANTARPETPIVKKREKSSQMIGKLGSEAQMDSAQLQALQNAIAGDPGSFLGGQFLPYFIPGFASCFSPQLPGGVQGGYFPPLCGMENLFPYGPAMPQAIAGLSPTALLQQYQQSLQDSLQKQQQKQSEHKQKPPSMKSQHSNSVKPKEAIENKDDKGSSTESTNGEAQTDTKSPGFPDAFIVPSIKHEFICRKCQMIFADEDSAARHQKSFCYFGHPFIDPQETVLRKAVSKYNCVACKVSVSGNEALGQHLQSSVHKEKTIKQAMRNAKEHARLLPHSVCSPCPNTTSTSQSAASSNNTLPHLSHLSMKSWPNILFQASARKAASCPSASPPTLSLPSTVTSTSCSTSGVQTSLPTESCSDESDSELSQKLDDLDNTLEVKAKTPSGLDGNFNSIRMDMFSV
ncbi:zinc finger homeobox protein 4 isoform X1 [Triplophysa dalaica]|uniref:zinc finger homeobox protein 4 isoform X1 n=1 Tax=Triplophysa dalaica TaxID=1582913 RepID=UPI0024DF8C33|nr:zinc finger homeobox protein 4 isoform X1 [Triplophysa dalaica]XP_056593983.1 zinc finger homeobox protein 4 isoform X1 [Triplophysa dalaica]